MKTSLEGKVALVTGASRGLGKVIALTLAERGADVALAYRTKHEEAMAVAEQIHAMGRKAWAMPVDLEGTGDLPRFLDDLEKTLIAQTGQSKFDILVNNAGVERKAVLGDVTEEDFDAVMNVNVKAVFFLTQKTLPLIKDGGRIILIGSGLSRFSFPPYIIYAATKAAQTTFASYMAKTLGPRGITVNVVAPGALATDFTRAYFTAHPEVTEMIAANTALGRVGKPDDVGGAVAFLASDDAGWITGQRIEASGGMYL